jgi:hypothetical protein
MKTIANRLGLITPIKGDVGIEIEIEGKNAFPVVDSHWRSEADGSLRGYSMEYVLGSPIPVGEVEEVLSYLKQQIQNAKSNPYHSFRAGVHVHLNVQPYTLKKVGDIAAVWYCLEKPLVRFCGSNREGNLFCLRQEDAEYAKLRLIDCLSSDDLVGLDTDNIRYAALNFKSIPRYGSLEFRSMETMPDFSKILEWCQMLVAIRNYALSIDNRGDIAYEVSYYGPEHWAKKVLGENLFKLINYESIEKDILRSLRFTQDLIYMET